jgi:hypothetical protein
MALLTNALIILTGAAAMFKIAWPQQISFISSLGLIDPELVAWAQVTAGI